MQTNNKKIYNFQSETKEILNLMIHSLYSNKEIFLRELISNSADAINKLKFEAIANPKLYENNTNFSIKISIDQNNNTLVISDNGIGMTYNDVINNLGIIAKSGTKLFLKSLNKIKTSENNLIGKFGVGFYSSFIVSKKVSVKTRFAGLKENEGVLWESQGKGQYEISKILKKERGTEITLYLKKEEKHFLESWKIKNIVKKYSNHINFPIEINNYDEKNKTFSWEKINQAQALWIKNKSQITNEEYYNFYKQLTNDSNNPIAWTHNKVEGTQEYTILLFIPKKAPWDIWNRDNKHGLQLYVKRVYIMDDAEQFLPNYLRFIKGIIDSNNLPLNISREILQDNKLIKNLKKSITTRILKLLENLTQDVVLYQKLWNEFGLILKEGPAEDIDNRDKIANLLRFSSMLSNTATQNISLQSYIDKMKKNQDKIYFITADNYNSAIDNPHLEFFKNRNIDVLILSDKIDEWMMNYLIEFHGKKFQSVSKQDDSIEKLIGKQEKTENVNIENMDNFLNKVKQILKDRIKEVKLTNKLTHTPAMIITDTNDMSTQMAKLFSAAGQSVPPIKYIFEINPNHNLIKKINLEKDDTKFENWIKLLFDQSLLAEKNTLDNPNEFITRMNNLLINY